MALHLPHHACDYLEAQAGAWLIEVEAVGQADAFVGNLDFKVSPDFPRGDFDLAAGTVRIGVLDRIGDEFVDQ